MNVFIKVSHRFGSQIIYGRKRQHLRHTLQCVPGDTISFEIPVYGEHGLQHVSHEVICKEVQGVRFGSTGVFVDNGYLPSYEAENFARAEGFIDLTELKDWYYAQHQSTSFEGFLLRW